MLVVVHAGEILMEQRPPEGIWGGLLSLPELNRLLSGDSDVDLHQQLALALSSFGDIDDIAVLNSFIHGFTHYRLSVTPVHVTLRERYLMASQSSSTSSLQGSTTFQFTGAAYFPNATFDGSGASGLGSSTNQCMYLLAGSLVLAGNSYFNSACWGVGTLSFTAVSPQTSYSAKLSK